MDLCVWIFKQAVSVEFTVLSFTVVQPSKTACLRYHIDAALDSVQLEIFKSTMLPVVRPHITSHVQISVRVRACAYLFLCC